MENTKTPLYSWYALGLLTLVYVMNFLDRTVIFFLFTPIKAEFGLTDFQLALIGSTAFVIFYTVLGIPFGRIADKKSRKNLIGIGLVIWSVFSGLTGFADGFWTLFLCRLMVGVGEATLGSAALSLLNDYFPPAKRATVASIYALGIALGAGSASFLVGYLNQFGWRVVFFVVGFPGVILAVLVFLLREPERGATEKTDTNYSATDWKKLLTNKSLLYVYFGFALLGLATNNLNIWGATFYTRVHKLDIATILFWGGVLTLIGGIPATLFSGVIAEKFRQKNRGGRMLYGSIISALCVPLWILLLSTDNVYLLLFSNLMLLYAALAWFGASTADVTEIAGVNLRGLGIAIFFFCVNIAAYLIGSSLIGKLNDVLGATENPNMMRYSMLVCPISCGLSAICLFIGSRSLRNEI
jgi:MFS family permease